MKRSVACLFMVISMMTALTVTAQTLLAKWTFPTGAAGDSLADGGIAANLAKAIHTEGGTSAIDFSKNGYTTKAAQATGWDNGAMTKCWVVEITSHNYKNLKISSRQQSGGNNPGPRDFILQYRLGNEGTWTGVPNSVIVTANNWTSGVLDSLPLPDTCANQSSLFLRWLMTTDTNTTGAVVASTGIDKIDEIFITGDQISTGIGGVKGKILCRVSPNPTHGDIFIEAGEAVTGYSLLNSAGKCVSEGSMPANSRPLIRLGTNPAGTYILRVKLLSGKTISEKLILL